MGVLRAPPSDKKDLQGVRTWALDVINRHSGTRLQTETETALRTNPLPFEPSMSPYDSRLRY